jgi:hypothetical protein
MTISDHPEVQNILPEPRLKGGITFRIAIQMEEKARN